MSGTNENDTSKADIRAEKARKRAEALRQNLRRRKSQQKERDITGNDNKEDDASNDSDYTREN